MIGQCLGPLAGDDSAGAATIEDEARGQLRPVDARLSEEREHLG